MQSIDGVHTSHGPNLGLDAHFTAAGSSNRSGADGREMECLEVVPIFVQEKSSVADPGEKDNRRSNQLQEYSSTQIISRLQQPCNGEGNEDGYFDTVVDVVPRKGDNKGDAVVDGMEFEEGSGAAISC